MGLRRADKHFHLTLCRRCCQGWREYTAQRKQKWKRDIQLEAHYRHIRLRTGWRHWCQGIHMARLRRRYYLDLMMRGDRCRKRRYWLAWLEYLSQKHSSLQLNANALAFFEQVGIYAHQTEL